MGRRDELIRTYAEDLRTKCGIDPDLDLLEKVAIHCGPAIYDTDAAVVSASDQEELAHIRENFLIRKLDMLDGPDLSDAIEVAIDTYGRNEPRKYRAVLYYLLTKYFRKEAAYSQN